MKLTTRLKALSGLVLLCAAGVVSAQAFPARAVTIIIPYPAGTTTDNIARVIQPVFSQRLGQTVVIENRAGAGGSVGVQALKASRNDGYTIGLIVSGNVIQPWLTKEMPFDVRKDFVPLSLMYAGPYVLNVAPSFPARTVPEFIAYVKANPTKVFFGSSGAGTTTHLAGELLKQLAGINMTHIPFKGSPEVYGAIGSGDIQAAFDLWGTSRGMVQAGRLRALAVTSRARSEAIPNLPALAEQVPGYEILVWTGFAAPLGTPAAAVTRLVADLRAAMAEPEVKKRVLAMGVDVGGNTPEEFAKFVSDDYDKWGRVTKAAGLKPN